MPGNNTEKSNQSGSSKRGFVIIAIFLVIVIALVAVIAFLLGRNTSSPETGNETSGNGRNVVESSRLVLDEQEAANVMEEMRKDVEEGMFECSMSMDWTFEDGYSESKDALVENSSNNTHPIYFDVVLDGSDEVIYSSPILPVGTQLTNFKLDVPLEAGTYKALCKYTLLKDEETQEPLSSANFVITINVQK